MLLKIYRKEKTICTLAGGVNKKTFCKWSKEFVVAIGNLESSVVSHLLFLLDISDKIQMTFGVLQMKKNQLMMKGFHMLATMKKMKTFHTMKLQIMNGKYTYKIKNSYDFICRFHFYLEI